ncbi:hypothetical protein PX699_07435 [Sphingobium sp. H39-3-25]|uniref:hypothetical protein n=1 Tax=Sphingobium arseniciresistens TaxID=3030834 RepID=UPI0023B8FB78|nr:hypothetical protein [Sphingobium arseniciresistens]
MSKRGTNGRGTTRLSTGRIALALGALLLLAGCLVTPGKFTSTLDIRADRSFTFTYKGEVIALDMDKAMQGESAPDLGEDDDATETPSGLMQPVAFAGSQDGSGARGGSGAKGKTGGNAPKGGTEDAAEADFSDMQDDPAKMEAIAAALSKEKGFRVARYLGDHKFEIDYAITGTLDHSFVFPFNIDAQLVFPFIAIELRGDDRIRMKAPGYANESSKSQGAMAGMGSRKSDASAQLDGTFTLTSAAPIISQNQEDGPTTLPDGRQQLRWTVNSLTTEAPMAVIRFGQ